MKFPFFVMVGIIGVAIANDTVYMNEFQKLRCEDLEASGGRGGGHKCCDYHQCANCGIYERCCYKPGDGGDIGDCMCGVNAYPQGTCY